MGQQIFGTGIFIFLGGLAGAFGAMLAVTLQSKYQEKRERQNRDRERLESMHKALDRLRKLSAMRDQIARRRGCLRVEDQWSTKEVATKDLDDKSAELLENIAMLCSLYFPQLETLSQSVAGHIGVHILHCNVLIFSVGEPAEDESRRLVSAVSQATFALDREISTFQKQLRLIASP